MGDLRYDAHYRRVLQAADRAAALRHLADDEVIQALAAASRARDALLANVLATEAMNRMRRSRVITENLVEGAFAVDADCRLLFVNPALARMTGAPWESALGRPFSEVVVLLDPQGSPVDDDACPVQRTLREARVVTWVGMLRPAAGAPLAVEMTAAAVEREGQTDGAVATVRDVSASRRLLARYQSLFHHLLQPTFFLDESGTIVDLNPAALEVLRARPDEVRGQHFGRFLAEEEVELAAERFTRVLQGERRADEYTIVRPDGTRVILRVTGIPMLDESGIAGIHGLGEVVREVPASDTGE